MDIPNFLLSIVSGMIANTITNKTTKKEFIDSNVLNNETNEKIAENILNVSKNVKFVDDKCDVDNEDDNLRFKSFEQMNIFEFLPLMEEPRVHIIFESKPSTYYHLPAFVLECAKTNQWYVFRRGHVAAEGSGSGWHKFNFCLEKFSEKGIKYYPWVLKRELLDSLENGEKLWLEVSNSKIPLLATNLDYFNERIK